MPQNPRQTVRAKHSARDWREQVRAECLSRVQEQRGKLLRELRARGRSTPEDVKASLDSILADVANTHSGGPDAETEVSATPGQAAHCDSGGFSKPLQWSPEHLSGPEYETLLAEMEAALFEEAEREELQAIEAAEHDAVSEAFLAHCMATSTLMDVSTGGQDQVLCPVCQDSYLVESSGMVGCLKDGYSIEAPMPGSGHSLSILKAKLAEVLEQHRLGGCHERPAFFVTNEVSGISTLYMQCLGCLAFEALL